MADAGPVLAVGGAAVAAGGALVLAAAAALAAGAGKLIFAAVQYGVEQTAAAEKQKAILDKLTGGRGAVTFDLALSLAGETGQTPEVAIERVKQLMAAKFSTAEIPLLIKASADLGAVKGDEKGKALLEKLEMIANKGKVGQESLDGLSEAGVNATAVLEKLRKKGESLDAVRLRLKAGTIFAACMSASQAAGSAMSMPMPVSISRRRLPMTISTSTPSSAPARPMCQVLNSAVANALGAPGESSIVTTATSAPRSRCSASASASSRASVAASRTSA